MLRTRQHIDQGHQVIFYINSILGSSNDIEQIAEAVDALREREVVCNDIDCCSPTL